MASTTTQATFGDRTYTLTIEHHDAQPGNPRAMLRSGRPAYDRGTVTDGKGEVVWEGTAVDSAWTEDERRTFLLGVDTDIVAGKQHED